ncbi:MAG: hypothetical protein MK085_03240 [Phycisphaerales bacterium]|nr:hypothetical protein [Phycisphaerales bacterium]
MTRFSHLVAATLACCTTLGALAANGIQGTLRFGDYTIDSKGVVTADVLWSSNTFTGGFQFDIVGAEITGVAGGITEELDWLVDNSPNRVLGVDLSGTSSIEPSNDFEVLLELKMIPPPGTKYIEFDGVVFSEPGAVEIPVDSSDRLILGDEPCPADLSGNGMVDGEDVGLFLVSWGTDDPAADLNGNGIVDGPDLGLLLAGWGLCP